MTDPTPLASIRGIAQDMLNENRFDGLAAVLLGLVANAERQMAAVRLEERRRIGAWIRTDARHAPSLVAMGAISLAEEIEQGLYLAGGTDQDGGAPRDWAEQPD